MKKIILILLFVSFLKTFGQTTGTLTFSFTEAVKTPTYNGDQRHTLAVYIQTNANAFVKTKMRYCCTNSTNDHLPTWAPLAGATATTAKMEI